MTKPGSIPTASETLTVSSKYQVVLPRRVREALGIRPGQKLQALVIGGRIELVPIVPMRELRGFLPGLDTDVPREDDRE